MEKLAPGFKFEPSDEDLICQHLALKNNGVQFPYQEVIFEHDLYAIDPWVLWSYLGDDLWRGGNRYLYTKLTKKSNNRIDRSVRVGDGCWHEQAVYDVKDSTGKEIGCKRRFCFKKKSQEVVNHWILFEYKAANSLILEGKSNDYVVCCIRKSPQKRKFAEVALPISAPPTEAAVPVSAPPTEVAVSVSPATTSQDAHEADSLNDKKKSNDYAACCICKSPRKRKFAEVASPVSAAPAEVSVPVSPATPPQDADSLNDQKKMAETTTAFGRLNRPSIMVDGGDIMIFMSLHPCFDQNQVMLRD